MFKNFSVLFDSIFFLIIIKKNTLKSVLLDSAASTTIHGIPFFIRTKTNSTKSMWIFSQLITVVVCSWMLLNIFTEFFKFHIVTNIYVNQENTLLFPAVTVCNHFDSPHYPDEFIAKLRFEYKLLNTDDYCFRINISFARGNGFFKCSKINGGKNLLGQTVDLLKSRNVGKDEGLAILFNTTFLDVFNDVGSKKIFQYYVTNNQVQPTSLEINSFILNKNEKVNVAIKKTISERLDYPFNNCQKTELILKAADRSIIQKIADSNTTYSQETCFELCIEAYLAQMCNCSYFGVLRTENYYEEDSDCNKGKLSECLSMERLRLNKIERCASKCPLECDTTQFDLTAVAYQNNSESTIKVFFSSLRYTLIRQIPQTTLTDVLASVGGTLGKRYNI